MIDDQQLLAQLAQRCQRNFAASEQAQTYLRQNGIINESVWNAYRLGVGDANLLAELDDAQRGLLLGLGLTSIRGHNPLASASCVLPTFDPRSPEQPVGLVCMKAAQNKHNFLTPPAGLACPVTVDPHAPVILCDAPILTLRLAQAGASNVCLAEDVAVLSPLADWLKGKKVLVVSRGTGLSPLGPTLEKLGICAGTVILPTEIQRASEEALTTIGIKADAFKVVLPPAEPITPKLVAALIDFSRQRLTAGEGLELLKSLGADQPDLVEAYSLGYLPRNFRHAMPAEQARSLSADVIRRRVGLGNAVIVPAVDRDGVPVDIISIQGDGAADKLFDPPLGLLGARIATVNEEIVVVDSFGALVDRWRKGERNILLVRGAKDACQNAQRIFDSGVRAATVVARRESKEIASALEGAGIDVGRAKCFNRRLPTLASDDDPILVSFDQRSRMATFKANDASYSVEVPPELSTRGQVRMERGGMVATGQLDLALGIQRRRFAASATIRTGLDSERIVEHLVRIFDQVLRIQEEEAQPVLDRPRVDLADAERQQAVEFLKRPDLLDAAAADLGTMGWTGEEKAKKLAYLVATSRKLKTPLSALRQSSAGKSMDLGLVGDLIPDEDVLHVSRLTASALHNHADLEHKLILIDSTESVSSEAWNAIQILQIRGALSQSYAVREALGTAAMAAFHEAKGPVAVVVSGARRSEESGLARCYVIPSDESPEQIERVLEQQRRMCSTPDIASREARAGIVKRHHAIQRVLEHKAVLIPFAQRIQFPNNGVRYRFEQEKFLGLIEASTLLHQYQRLRHKTRGGEELIVADLRDYQIAAGLAAHSIAQADDELTENARDILRLVTEAKLTSFTMEDLKKSRPGWTRYRFRAGLDELLKVEALTSPRRGRGAVREYAVQPWAESMLKGASVRLLEVGELAEVGEGDFANLTPNAATG